MALNSSLGPNGWTADIPAPVSGGGIVGAPWKITDGYPLMVAPDSSTGVTFTQQGGSSGFATGFSEVDSLKCADILTGAGFWTEINIPTFSRQNTNGRFCLLVKIDDVSKLNNAAVYLGTAGYADLFIADYNVTTRLDRQYSGWMLISPELPGGPGAFKWAASGGAPNFSATTFAASKVRFVPVAGQQLSVHVAGVWLGGGQAEKPQIVFTFDDGYESAVVLGATLCEKYGFRSTQAIIGSTLGTATYATLEQVSAAKTRGHCLVAHGAPPGGSLAAVYTTTAEVQADIQSNLTALQTVIDAEERKCYVYPQGVHAHSPGDLRIKQALVNLGIDFARGASENAPAAYNSNLQWIADKSLRLPIVGHTFAGGGEAANITAIIGRMQEAIASGRDCVVMLHKVLTIPPTVGLEIQDTNLVLLLKAAAELVATGGASPGTLVTLRRKMLGGQLFS